MASESPTRLAREAQEAINRLKQEHDFLQRQFNDLNLLELRERVAVLESHVRELKAQLDEHKPTRAEGEELGALKSRLHQLEEQKKLGDTRLFQFILLFVGGIITLSVQIALLFLKK